MRLSGAGFTAGTVAQLQANTRDTQGWSRPTSVAGEDSGLKKRCAAETGRVWRCGPSVVYVAPEWQFVFAVAPLAKAPWAPWKDG